MKVAGLARGVVRVVAAGEVTAARPLDLDDPRAEVGQLTGRERGGHRPAQVRRTVRAVQGVPHYEPTKAGRCFARNGPHRVAVVGGSCPGAAARRTRPPSESVNGRDPPSGPAASWSRRRRRSARPPARPPAPPAPRPHLGTGEPGRNGSPQVTACSAVKVGRAQVRQRPRPGHPDRGPAASPTAPKSQVSPMPVKRGSRGVRPLRHDGEKSHASTKPSPAPTQVPVDAPPRPAWAMVVSGGDDWGCSAPATVFSAVAGVPGRGPPRARPGPGRRRTPARPFPGQPPRRATPSSAATACKDESRLSFTARLSAGPGSVTVATAPSRSTVHVWSILLLSTERSGNI